MVELSRLGEKLERILLQGVRACYLVRDRRTALIDSGLPSDAPDLAEGLARAGLAPGDLDVLVLTHGHADHAGGAGHLARANPALEVYAHPLCVSHLRDPERLNRAVRRAYGDRYDQVGALLPVAGATPVRAVTTGDAVELGSTVLRVLDAPGHCKHHVVLHEPRWAGVFSGDALGSWYSGLPNFVLSPPSDYDPVAAKRSIDAVSALRPEVVYFAHNTHHRLSEAPGFFRQLKDQHDLWVGTVAAILEQDAAIGPQDLFDRFLQARGELRDHASQRFSFGLSVRGIRGYLQGSGRPATKET